LVAAKGEDPPSQAVDYGLGELLRAGDAAHKLLRDLLDVLEYLGPREVSGRRGSAESHAYRLSIPSGDSKLFVSLR
jgi:hypothetical protein